MVGCNPGVTYVELHIIRLKDDIRQGVYLNCHISDTSSALGIINNN